MMQTRPEKTTIIMWPCAGTADVGQLTPEINYAAELQLVKDAIIAESTRLTEVHPVIVGGCCCC